MPNDRTRLLFANEAFYRAFADRDMAHMAELWSNLAPVTCVHPGWPPLRGREEVLESWQRILENPSSPEVEITEAKITRWGDVAMVVCYERVDDSYLVATNIFVRENKGWKIVHHQASPVATPPPGHASNDDENDEASDEAEEEIVAMGAMMDEDEDGDDDPDLPPSRSIH